jgi:hypothetical protein
MAPSASKKTSDTDFHAMLYSLTASRTCGCCQERPRAPFPAVPLGGEEVALSEEALKLRGEVIAALLPKLRVLVTELTAFNTRGGIGPGEIDLLGELQHWVLQLQVEEDALRLTRPAEE